MPSTSPTAVIDFAITKWQGYPGLQIQDAYKWLFQATRGGEHLISDIENATAAIEKEWVSVGGTFVDEPLWESLRPDEEIGRLNLRPFKDAGGEPADLAQVFVESSARFLSKVSDLLAVWIELGERLLDSPTGQLNHAAWSELDRRLGANEYPALHHSDRYRRNYKPAYRVLTVSAFESLPAEVRQR